MHKFSRLIGSVAVAALLMTATSPAAARGHGHWRHHDRGPSAGAVIGTLAAVGLIAAIASSAKNKREDAQRRYEDRPEDRSVRDDRDYDYERADRNARRFEDGRPMSQDEAVDACVVAARDAGSRNGTFAEIHDVTGVSRLGNGWDVAGRIERRSSYRATDGNVREFRCAYEDGRVSAVSIY